MPAPTSYSIRVPKRVLVVEDDIQVLRLLRVNLEMEDYEVVVAEDGEEALDAVEGWTPDLIVSDVMMPGMDGVELVRRLRDCEKTKDTPIIILSAKAQQDDIEAGIRAGADRYLTKPFDPSELLTVVSEFLGR